MSASGSKTSSVKGIPKWISCAVIFLALVAIDQITKSSAQHPVLNSGFFLGSLEWASPFYRIFCTLAFLSISLLVIALIQFLTYSTLPILTFVLTVLQAGLVGNGIDRLTAGTVRDFIRIDIFHPALILNFADLCQWVSLLSILAIIWVKPHSIWPKNNLRSRILIFPASQLRMTGVLMLLSSLIGFGVFLLMSAYLRSTGVELNFEELLICFLFFMVLVLLVVFIFGMRWSLRVYGPFRAVERYLKERAKGGDFKLRAADENEVVKAVIDLIQKSKIG
jgi:lipoprotein signal peptidase